MQFIMFKDVCNQQRQQNSQRRKEKHHSDVCFHFAVVVFARCFSFRRSEFWSLLIEYIFEHYKLHLWKKWGKLIGKQLWNWRVAKLDTLSIQVAKLNLLLVQHLACVFSTNEAYNVQRCIQSSETPKFTTAKRKTSLWRLFSFSCCCFF